MGKVEIAQYPVIVYIYKISKGNMTRIHLRSITSIYPFEIFDWVSENALAIVK